MLTGGPSGPNPALPSDPGRDLSGDAIAIWNAGVDAVRPERLFERLVSTDRGWLVVRDTLGDETAVDLASVPRIWVVGGGKAGAAMALGFERSLGERLAKQRGLRGLLSVPADCLPDPRRGDRAPASIELVAGRPAGRNEPHEAGESASRRMLRMVADADADDLVVCLLSGGGSALLPAPAPPVTLAEKRLVTKLLSDRGATIDELNVVRQHLSDIKGGGLARACRARRLWTLLISDVLAGRVDLVASGPTITPQSTAVEALAVLARYGLDGEPALATCVDLLRAARARPAPARGEDRVVVLANNATAADAAGAEAVARGYRYAMTSSPVSEGPAEEVGARLAEDALALRDGAAGPEGPDCLIQGGEPTVALPAEGVRGRGGRNQQLALAALAELGPCEGIALVSGGTDGEDGPTDAAGAIVDHRTAAAASRAGLDAADHLARCDAYSFFQAAGGLLKTGPTHTNVCDLRVVTTHRRGR